MKDKVKIKYLDEDTLKEIGIRCLEIRENYNEYRILSQREFADKLKITHSRVSLIEAGKAEMTLTELHAYQKAGRTSFDYLMGKSETKKADNDDINKRLGLTEKAIEVLEGLKTKKDTATTSKTLCAQQLRAINCLIENEPNFGIFGHISFFLWREYKGLIEVLEKTGKTLAIPASKLNNIFMLDIEKYLHKLKEYIQEEKNSKKRK